MPDLKVGDLAPSINDLEWVRGESLEAFQRGKVYIIAFMTTTCPACAREMPRLRQLQKNTEMLVLTSSVSCCLNAIQRRLRLELMCTHG
ncbi:redoxin family protein [Rhizobium leguminosarum]|uniref:redoxin family protein n=1 Tax=Rhizobium leguminosarum TaxID=384 RepID=UPI001C901559|nr:redoxin family protein [Rhizobium leguminosarum]